MSARTTCSCPEIEDQDWHLQDQDWSGKFFYFDDLPHLFGAPLGMEKRRQEMKSEIARKGYELINPDLVLHRAGSFQGKLLMEIKDPEQYDANVERFDNARVLSRVYLGPRSRLRDAVEELKAFTQDRTHIEPTVIYFWHVTCAKCAERRGGDKTVLFARV